MSKTITEPSSKSPSRSHSTVSPATGCSSFSKTRRKSNSNGIGSKDTLSNSLEISTIKDSAEPEEVNANDDSPPWTSLLMLGIDDPNRMSFTQSLAFTSSQTSSDGQRENPKHLGGHIALQRRLNNYAKIITIVVLAMSFAFVFSYLYKNFLTND